MHPKSSPRFFVFALVATCIIAGMGSVAHAQATKCKGAIAKGITAYVTTRTKVLQKCENAKVKGKLGSAVACASESATVLALAKATDKLESSIAKACGGDDKQCGTADDASLAGIGWDIGTCPNFAQGDCTNAINSCADISECLTCIADDAADQAIDTYYGELLPSDPGDDKALIKCQAAIGKFTAGYAAARAKALAACWATVNKAGSGSCPDGSTTASIESAAAKRDAGIAKACDELTPAQIGFAATCPAVTPPGGTSCAAEIASLDGLVECVGCVTDFEIDCVDRAAVPAYVDPYPAQCNAGELGGRTCDAQRAVHIVAGNGSLAWFTLLWPAPAVVTGFQVTYAYDDPAKAPQVPGTATDHPLYARLVDTRTLWEGIGAHVDPSVFVAGTNQTHSLSPVTTTIAGVEILAAGAVRQASLGAPLPVLRFGTTGVYGPAPGAPPAVNAATIDDAIAELAAVTPISPEIDADLRPTIAELAAWGVDGSTPAAVTTLAQRLLFTAAAFRLGLVSTVLIPGYNDDPHGAFSDVAGTVTPRADGLARILDGFYAELGQTFESCGDGKRRFALADNVALVVSGDTPKNSFNRAGWPDGTPANSNLLYVRSNGFLKPGWFGSITSSTRVNFDPSTGALDAGASVAGSTSAAQLGILYAIARGDTATVEQVSAAPYEGVIESGAP